MDRLYAQMSDGSTIHREVDQVELEGNAVYAYRNGKLILYMDLGCVLYLQINEPKQNVTERHG